VAGAGGMGGAGAADGTGATGTRWLGRAADTSEVVMLRGGKRERGRWDYCGKSPQDRP
jgi:hypothetical protein